MPIRIDIHRTVTNQISGRVHGGIAITARLANKERAIQQHPHYNVNSSTLTLQTLQMQKDRNGIASNSSNSPLAVPVSVTLARTA